MESARVHCLAVIICYVTTLITSVTPDHLLSAVGALLKLLGRLLGVSPSWDKEAAWVNLTVMDWTCWSLPRPRVLPPFVNRNVEKCCQTSWLSLAELCWPAALSTWHIQTAAILQTAVAPYSRGSHLDCLYVNKVTLATAWITKCFSEH